MLAAGRVTAIVLLALVGTANAFAATLVAGNGDTAAGGHSTNVPYTFNIGPYNLFNPSTGGLRDIDFSLQANLFGQINVMTSVANTFAVDLAAKYVVDYPGTATAFLTDASAFENDPADPVPAGGAIIILSGQATPDYSTNTLDPISKVALFSHFIGTGTYTLPVNADKVASVAPAPSGGYTSAAAARAKITVTYTYGLPSLTAATALTAIYSANAQSGALRATISSNGSAVNEGTVHFYLSDGVNVIGNEVTAAPNVGGVASAAFTLPAGQALGTYTIVATYDGGSSYGLSQGSAPFYIRSDEIFTAGFGTAGGH
jgi:hypothetical protein